jgi:3-methyl-2-oxobutanoate hydroxymethyltransferase
MIEDAKALEKSGVFCIVLECVPKELAKIITECISIPTIGIGAGKECDGQVLVSYDMIGLFSDYVPFFVKQYAEINKDIKKAVDQYVNEVREGEFPDENN